jgi:hypothetical protein
MNPDQNQNPQFTPQQPGQDPTPQVAQPVVPDMPTQPQLAQPVVEPQPMQQPQVPQMAQPAQPQQPMQPTTDPTPMAQPIVGVQPTMPTTGPVVSGMPGQSPVIDPVTGLPMQQPAVSFAQQPQSFATGTGSKFSKKNLMLAAIAIVVVAVLGFGAYLLSNMLTNNNNKNKTNQAASQSTSKTNATPLSSLKGVSFMAPMDMSSYTLNTASTDKVKIYTKGDCSLQFGTTDAASLPGTDLADIVSRQIKTLRDNGVTVDGPTAGDALVLKDSSNSSKQYSMPTLVFKANKDKNYAMSYYSAVVFSDGTRAFVTRACASTTAAVQASALSGVAADAQKVTVMAQ